MHICIYAYIHIQRLANDELVYKLESGHKFEAMEYSPYSLLKLLKRMAVY